MGVIVVHRRWTAPATSPSYSALTRRSAGDSAADSMTLTRSATRSESSVRLRTSAHSSASTGASEGSAERSDTRERIIGSLPLGLSQHGQPPESPAWLLTGETTLRFAPLS